VRLRELFEATGRVVKGVNTTQDVDSDEIKTQAAKYGFDVDKDGRPPTLSKKTKGGSTNVLYNLGLSESQVKEIEKDTHTEKDVGDEYMFDEYIGRAKPAGFKVNGYEIYRVSKHDDEIDEVLLIKDPNSEGFLGEVVLINDGDGAVHSQVVFTEQIQGKNLAVPLYAYAIKKLGYTIISDKTQTKGSQTLWARLSKVPGVFVYGWDRAADEYFQWDPEVDPEEEVYYDKDQAGKIQAQAAEVRAEVSDLVKSGEISNDQAGDLLRDKMAAIQKQSSDIDKVRWSDLRLVATTTKGLGK